MRLRRSPVRGRRWTGSRTDAALGGSRWRIPRTPDAGVLWWCWSDDNAIVAVGEDGSVLRNRGENWVRDEVPEELESGTFFGVWGSSEATVVAVGGAPRLANAPPIIAHFRDRTWTAEDTTMLGNGTLFKIWGTADDNLWAVGSPGLIAHFDGNRWRKIDSPTEAPLIAVHGSAANDIFAVGGQGGGEILHFDGDSWRLFANAPEELSAVWTAPGEPLYVGGDRGFLARYDRRSGAISSVDVTTAVPTADVCFHGLFGRSDAVVAVGADLIAGGDGGWRGAAFSHGRSFAGRVPETPTIDAAPPTDSAPSDATTVGPGETCNPIGCHPGLTCWFLQFTDIEICTRGCTTADECSDDYGEGACCERPGIQVLDRVCLPADSQECENPI